MFIKYEAEVSSRVGGGERGVVDFGKLFTETNEQKFISSLISNSNRHPSLLTPSTAPIGIFSRFSLVNTDAKNY